MGRHRARKRFGQHFLSDSEFVNNIIAAIAPRPGETLVEIGPGRGALTLPLSEVATKLHAIELDRNLVNELRQSLADRQNVTLHQADALNFDFSAIGTQLRVVGNLPYNISTPLLFHLLEQRDLIADMHFMLQKEVVDRICAAPGSKTFGRLTVMLGSYLESVALFEVPPAAFTPPPRVTSAVIRLRPRPDVHVSDHNVLASLVAVAFSKRRKTLRNALANVVSEEQLMSCGIEPSARAETIAVSDWVALSNTISNRNNS
ncbi:MAG: 16S rRNA (adenine(1518)-N(6)/adenine(1519)-N(6))-dimethyltransferase RsmA [Gammaproteobacteria bacterium]|nr:16S rRNA (adenine(1518)-N(6)/adenine(1519)-N(6))-dimethyltransferase RsmA [Gammaproteobacteria bacterium]